MVFVTIRLASAGIPWTHRAGWSKGFASGPPSTSGTGSRLGAASQPRPALARPPAPGPADHSFQRARREPAAARPAGGAAAA